MSAKNSYQNKRIGCKDSRKEGAANHGLRLTLVVPAGKRKYMCRILKPILRNVRELSTLLEVTERPGTGENQGKELGPTAPNYTVSSHELSTPALAVMLFLPEHSQTCPDATSVRRKFLEFPWRYHHSIQLQNVAASPSVLGQQEFYFLSRQLPLWSVSAGPQPTGLKLRFNIFVRRFNAMVEFYRLVTNSEMESKKAGFCVFPLTSEHFGGDLISPTSDEQDSSSITCELALKQCPMVNPFPLSDAYLSFPVSNLTSLLRILPTQARPVSNQHYLIHDPDGNPLILFDTGYHGDTDVMPGIEAHVPASIEPNNTRLVIDKSSEHEFSIDSGRYSDFETSSYELENCMSKVIEEVDLLKNDSGRHRYEDGILSPSCRNQNTGLPDQTMLRSKHRKNDSRFTYSHVSSDNNVQFQQPEKCTKNSVHKVFTSDNSMVKCNSATNGSSIDNAEECPVGLEPSLSSQGTHAWVSGHKCRCMKNVFPADALLNGSPYFSETEL